jgi:hypothetical protein
MMRTKIDSFLPPKSIVVKLGQMEL